MGMERTGTGKGEKTDQQHQQRPTDPIYSQWVLQITSWAEIGWDWAWQGREDNKPALN